MRTQNRKQHFPNQMSFKLCNSTARRIEQMLDKHAIKRDKLHIPTFTQLLLHVVSNTVNGGVILSIQDIGRWWSIGNGYQLRRGDLTANSNSKYCNALCSCLHTCIHLKRHRPPGENEPSVVNRTFILTLEIQLMLEEPTYSKTIIW